MKQINKIVFIILYASSFLLLFTLIMGAFHSSLIDNNIYLIFLITILSIWFISVLWMTLYCVVKKNRKG